MLTPERRAELRGLAESARPFIRHGGTDPAAVYVPATDFTALLDAADERDRLAAQVEQAWRDGYYTGKRDYACSITGGAPISTPNPYIAARTEGAHDYGDLT